MLLLWMASLGVFSFFQVIYQNIPFKNIVNQNITEDYDKVIEVIIMQKNCIQLLQ